VWPVSSGHPPHLIIGINVTTYFSHHNLPYRSFLTGSPPRRISSISTHLQGSSPRFSLTVHHTGVSTRCSVRRFDGCSGKPPSEDLSIDLSIVLHPFQSIRPTFKVDSSHTRFAAWRSGGFLSQKFNRSAALEPTTKLSYEALHPPLRQTAVIASGSCQFSVVDLSLE
jgi:hypothetical protein